MTKILVIKLSALGDIVLAMAPFKAIRAHHPDAHITLLTTAPYAGLGKACGYFDDVWVDTRPRLIRPREWLALGRKLREGGFTRVYDLQVNDRSGFYFRLFGRRKPEWSGIARGCSHPHRNPMRSRLHSLDRHVDQLKEADVPAEPRIDLTWAAADITRFGLDGRYGLLVPGGSAHRPEKRWPAAHYAELATRLAKDGIRPVLIGGGAEEAELSGIAAKCPEALNLCAETSFEEIIVLARGGAVAVGNDTGPMHLIGAADCPSVALYSHASDPALTAPRGASVTIIQRPSLDTLDVEAVIAEMRPR